MVQDGIEEDSVRVEDGTEESVSVEDVDRGITEHCGSFLSLVIVTGT